MVQLTVLNFSQYSFFDFYYVVLDFLLMGHFSVVGDLCTVLLLKWEFFKVPSHSALSHTAWQFQLYSHHANNSQNYISNSDHSPKF